MTDNPVRATETALLAAVDHCLIPDTELSAVAELAAIVRSGRELNRFQAALAWRVLHRHRARLAARGVTLPGPRVEAQPPVTVTPGQRPEVLIRGDGRIGIRHAPFGVNENLKLGLHATFDNRHKEWHLSPTPVGAAGVLALLSGHDPEVTPRVLELADEVTGSHRAVLDPDNPAPDSDIGHLVLSPLWEHQRRALAYSSAVSASMIAVPMGGGKALDVSTPIATPGGWTTMGDLESGDQVFDDRGQVCTVVQAHPVLQNRTCYEVVFSDGETVIADADHLWWTHNRSDREKQCYHRRRGSIVPLLGSVNTTEQIRSTLTVGARELTNHSVVVADALTLPDVSLPIPPYMLGAWLGDGDSNGGRITTADGAEMRELFSLDGYFCGKNSGGADRTETFTVHGLVTQLRSLDLIKNKHVPGAYLRASEKQRRALLAGLLDTDGTVCRHGRIQFDSIRERLAADVLELARSLGYRATMSSKDAKLNGCVISRVWRVSFTTADSVFRLSRKQNAHGERSARHVLPRVSCRYIVDVRPVESRPVRCVTVDSPSRLYLAGRALIPTHNTASTVATVNAVDAARVLIVCPNKVRGVWPREVAKWSARPWHIVDGKRPAKRKGALPQDLLVPERLHQAEECLFDCACGAPVHVAVFNYEMLSREPIASWVPLHQLDMIIYDEIHRLKSPTGKGSKVAGAWVDFSHRRIGLSGTPMPQHPWDIFGVYRALDPNIFGHVWTPFKSKYIDMQEAQIKTRSKAGDFYMKKTEFPSVIKPQFAEEFSDKVHSIMYRPTVDLKLPGVEHVTHEVELEPAAWKAYRNLDEHMFADLSEFAKGKEVDEEDAYLMPRNVIARIMRLMQLTGGTLPDDGEEDEQGKVIRQSFRVSTAKADALADILTDVGCVPDRPGGPEPVVVYCQFKSDLDAIRKVVEDAKLRYAEISGRRSDGLSSLGEMSENADVVGVQIQSGGTGVDLTRARYGVWYSKGHSLGDYDQALKRQDRPGQTRPVVFVHLIVPGTVDMDVQQGLMERSSVTAVFLRSRGLDPAAFGIDDTPVPAPEVDRSGRSGAQVVLPIDEFKPAPWNPARGHVIKPKEQDWALLKEFDLEDL